MTDAVLIVVPVLKRPERVVPFLASLARATSEPHRVLFVATEDDTAEIRAVRATGADLLIMPGRRLRGDYARKINYAYEQTDEPVLFLAADDLDFRPGWLSAARRVLASGYPVVGTNDLGNKRVMDGEHSTHTFVTREYCDRHGTIDRPGSVLHVGYNHWYVDDEFIQTARQRGMFAPCLDSHVEHLHYAWKKSPKDRTYRLGESRRAADRVRYYDRRPLWDADAIPPAPKRRLVPDPVTGLIRKP